MLKNIILSFLFLFLSVNVFSQNDSISDMKPKERKKLLKKKKKVVYNDSILLSNNDLLVGEIKKLEKSVITLKTKYSDSDFKIKWHQVVSMKSTRIFIVSTNDGERFNSTINSVDKKGGKVRLDRGVSTYEEDLMDIVYLEPIGKNFLSRLTIDLDFGLTMTKTNNLIQLTSNLSATYLANKWSSNGYYKTVLSRQDSISDINRMDANIGGQYYLHDEWFATLNAVYLSNDEQKLELRSTYKVGVGYMFLRNNRMFLGASGGLAQTSENYTDDTPLKNSTELFLGIGFNKYDIGKFSMLASAILYPSITEKRRYRSDVNLDMKYDLPLDFYIKMSLSYNYDNKPVEGADKDDYVYTTSFGWEFN